MCIAFVRKFVPASLFFFYSTFSFVFLIVFCAFFSFSIYLLFIIWLFLHQEYGRRINKIDIYKRDVVNNVQSANTTMKAEKAVQRQVMARRRSQGRGHTSTVYWHCCVYLTSLSCVWPSSWLVSCGLYLIPHYSPTWKWSVLHQHVFMHLVTNQLRN